MNNYPFLSFNIFPITAARSRQNASFYATKKESIFELNTFLYRLLYNEKETGLNAFLSFVIQKLHANVFLFFYLIKFGISKFVVNDTNFN